MHKNRLIKLLCTFDRKEMTRFCEFAHSPYHNKHGDVQRLVHYLSRIYPQFTAQRLDRTKLYKKLWPRARFEQSKLALVFTYTQRLLESFLATEHFQRQEIYPQILTLREVREKNQPDQYNRLRRQLAKKMDVLPHRSSDYYRLSYLAAAESDAFHSLMAKHEKDLSIQDKQRYLDQFYLSEKLRDACEMMLRAKILKAQYDHGLLEAVLVEIERVPDVYLSVPAISLYYHIYQMIRSPEPAYFDRALAELIEVKQLFENPELRSLFNYFQNYCIEKINQGDHRFLRESLNLYQQQLDTGLLIDTDGYLSEWHYKNIVTIALRLDEKDWTHQFIEQYRAQLPPASVENAYRFNRAAYAYQKGDYDQVMSLLLRVEYTDKRYELAAKSLLLRTYYDQEEYEAMDALAMAFKQYLKRNRSLNDYRRSGFANLVKFARRAGRIRSNIGFHSRTRTAAELKKLKEEVKTEDSIINRSWLEERLTELEQRLR